MMLSPPIDDGFRMPAEWEQHAACWMAFPHRPEAHDGRLDEARAAYAVLAHAIADFEPVHMAVHPQDFAEAQRVMSGEVTLHPMELDDAWLRDSGPTFIKNKHGDGAGVDWIFNAWGQKYHPYDKDDALAHRILTHLSLPRYLAPLVLEGGSIHTNGNGTLLTTRQCLLHPNRNPRLVQAEVEQLLRAYLGVRQIIWLDGDDRDDETDGHIDNIACFANETHVLMMDNPANPQYQKNRRLLEVAQTADCKPIDITALPQPIIKEKGVDLLASYVNFYIANGAIIMPTFDMPEDDAARFIIGNAFPSRVIRSVPALEIVRGGGGIHCVTQQQPLFN